MAGLGVGAGALHALDVRPHTQLLADSATWAPNSRRTVGSVVIPAHNEARVIRRNLERLFGSLGDGVEVIVACNGCTDDTADEARRAGLPVTVLELDAASKVAALRAADAATTAFPRVYLDADVLVSGTTVDAVLRHLGRAGALAARPRSVVDTSSSSWIVRRFYRARAEMPAVTGSLWGAGIYALSAEGRRRFDQFPPVIADDLFVDRLFRADEIEVVDTDPGVVIAPATARGLLTALRRVYRGNRAIPGCAETPRPGTVATVRDLCRHAGRGPAELVDAAVYASMVVVARALSWRYGRASDHWERDETSRR
jgi:Glycosyl transferase family 2